MVGFGSVGYGGNGGSPISIARGLFAVDKDGLGRFGFKFSTHGSKMDSQRTVGAIVQI